MGIAEHLSQQMVREDLIDMIKSYLPDVIEKYRKTIQKEEEKIAKERKRNPYYFHYNPLAVSFPINAFHAHKYSNITLNDAFAGRQKPGSGEMIAQAKANQPLLDEVGRLFDKLIGEGAIKIPTKHDLENR